jgi:Phosphoesterase family
MARGRSWVVLASASIALCPAHAQSPNPLGFAAAAQCTADPQAASSVPGWTIVAGSPALRCGEALQAKWPSPPAPRVVIANGPYGASVLERVIPLPLAAAPQRHFTLSASFAASGRGSGRPVLTARFLGASGEQLGTAVVLRGAPAAGPTVRFAPRSVGGDIPPGAIEIALRVELGGRTGFGRSYIAALRLATTPATTLPPPVPVPARVPRFAHVFLIMMENTDFGQVIGDTRNAPFMNALAARGALLANDQAVYHPSDQNYLAIAGGDTFVRGGAYFPNIHIAARNLGDLLEAAGESWKAYLEGMGTPCNVTTRYDEHFEPDDAPFINFSDIRRNPGRCRAHLVDLNEWPRDLGRAASTPAFAWLAADDYDDGELPGNGSPKSLRVQDAWLQRTLHPLFTSPAWRQERCLLILTWDESHTTVDNHIATIVIGSQGTVKSGYVSYRHYDHYSTGRTIEAALGLPNMTSNDAYAPALDDVFASR